ncbi:hypothetical protein JRG49_19240 [Pseudomonas fulva]|jgi:hypothetical protein|uniref:hypothetical protein n=1 Tax=Pseudomonas fulva TaxID=47880 RepID=UPI0019CFC822|nr:hypothetical protein [Pseudomonas fulva]MBN6792138.1 hypothetical protein [Pseudomonas fulva]MBN6797106.1 hypothetical protein [Pseudomonas fulva]MBN6857767.1 hypothetical protein [Pseudomonas fulva]MBN6874662.1 hypothetical protein [Pseudomonas fulva]MBN6879083.1 hypothetical protein [Pseudomonas fulva]
MSIELNEEEMRRALFGNGVQPLPKPEESVDRKPSLSSKARVTSKIRVTLNVTNVFEGACEKVVFDSDSLSRLVAEMDAKKKYKKKYKYVDVVSIECI